MMRNAILSLRNLRGRKGEIASGIARRVERRPIVVDLGRTEAYIPPREQIPGEQYKPGDRLQGYIADVRQTTRGPSIIMSRADERYLDETYLRLRCPKFTRRNR